MLDEVMMMGVHYITAVEQRRRSYWRKLFGTDELPVKSARPRFQFLEAGRHETLAYDLDTEALHPVQRARLARHMASTSGMRLQDAQAFVETHPIPIEARGTELLE